MQILYEDNHLLIVVKPAGLVTQGAAPDEPSLVSDARAYIKHKYHKPGNVYLGVVSRLDAVVSGVVVLARTSKAAERLNRQFREREVDKIYWALVTGQPRPAQGELCNFLVKDERQHKVVVAGPATRDAKEARLSYRSRGQIPGGTWLELKLLTGRKHQIRVQLAARGWPILGDAKYGSRANFQGGIALHARALEILHPITKAPVRCIAPLPPSWRTFGIPKRDDMESEFSG